MFLENADIVPSELDCNGTGSIKASEASETLISWCCTQENGLLQKRIIVDICYVLSL